MPASFTQLTCHIVFSTKLRQPFLTRKAKERIYKYLGGIVRGQGAVLLAIGGVEDHVHLMVSLRPDQSVSDFVRAIKGDSSRWVHQELAGMKDFAWQEGYGAFSVSKSQQARVKKYINNQVKHHQQQDSRSEFMALLEAHEIEFKEEYLV